MNYQFTIIIPHYNIPHLLKRCLWSIPKRDDTQVIVIDDKSDDDNIIKLKALELEYPYVTFIYSDFNGGGGRARNIGLQYAKGIYVLFADADDFFNYCINDILEKYKNKLFDMAVFNANYIDSDTYLSTDRTPMLNIYMDKYMKTKDLLLFRYMFGEPWCKLIRRELIVKNDIKFEESPIHNDAKFSYMIGYYSNNIVVDNIAIYCLADRTKSVSKGISDEKLLWRVKIFSEKNRFLEDHDIDLFDNLMIISFLHFREKGDYENIKNCYMIASNYGFSKFFIKKRMIKFEIYNNLRKVKSFIRIFFS